MLWRYLPTTKLGSFLENPLVYTLSRPPLSLPNMESSVFRQPLVEAFLDPWLLVCATRCSTSQAIGRYFQKIDYLPLEWHLPFLDKDIVRAATGVHRSIAGVYRMLDHLGTKCKESP